ncbi:aldehyde dehydrogenase [Alcaligenes faecalis]|uniref:aldehyde dehydrogenase family protein n=1 Tax=Alcaligenes faecalis TaxID=511 RepID=UPI001C828C87|nr:aldehyde dehydrogenase family protein [Alcaligenes faecalis]MBX6966156.1 aldehyde dehydrogenase family protein [Providencia rettgeri]MBX7032716.1 aldehyde dehydrogenase family protein [Alcaligenes faecalis]
MNSPQNHPAYIGGKTYFAEETFQAINASTGRLLGQLARCGAKEVDLAVQTASQAQKEWAQAAYEARAMLLNRLADALEQAAPRLAQLDAEDVGRRVSEVLIDYHIAVAQYRYFAAAIVAHEDFGRPIPDGYLIAKRVPLGVVGQIIPWNVPAIMVALKVAPAIAAGNAVILKPDENASLSTLEFARIANEIFPAGLINVLTGFGDEVGAALTSHPGVAKLAFTGSPEVGRIISQAGAKRLVPVSLELGGKSPNIVFPDIDDMDAVVDNALFAALYCNGQSCLAGTRLFVHDAIYTEFVDKLVAAARRVRIGDPADENTQLSCLINVPQGEKVLKYIQTGRDEGAKVLTGGQRVTVKGHEHGYFIEPTILETNNRMRVAQEEIFGPVLSVIRWSDVDEMIEQANDVCYGLAAGIYTSNLKNAMETADRLQAGNVWINRYFNLTSGSPFGGMKESGIGREHCRETLNMYSELKAITVQNSVPQPWFAPEA